MTTEAIRARVAAAPVGRLATTRPDGRVHLVPCCFALSGDLAYSAVDRKPKRSPRLERLANIDANPSVALLVDHYEEDWSRLWWVVLEGRARVIEEGPESVPALVLLTAKYPQYRADPPPGPFVEITVERWSHWSAEL